MNPRHIAIVGGHMLDDAVGVCRGGGFAGPVWPVSRSRAEAAGERCFAAIDALPDAPDATFIMASREATIEIVRDLRARGAGGAVCYASGYAESGGEGAALQQALVDASGDLAVVGPNCNGFVNWLDRVALWPNAELPVGAADGGVAILSQSGAFTVNIANGERSLPVAVLASIGNQAVLDAADYIAVLLEDPRVTAIGMFLEGIPDVPAFSAAALAALERDVPVVVLKAGATGAGGAKARTHTGAVVTSDDAVDALFRRCGVVRVPSASAFVETLKMLAAGGRPRGRRLAVITLSGGLGTLAADAATRAGLALPPPSAAKEAALAPRLPPFLPVANPLDCSPPIHAEQGLSMADREGLEACFATMLADDFDMGILFIDFPRGYIEQARIWEPSVDAMIGAAGRAGIPCAVAAMLPEALPAGPRERLARAGVAPLQGLDDAMTALAAAAAYADRQRAARCAGNIPMRALPSLPRLAGPSRPIDEATGKAWLAAAGVPIPAGLAVSDGDAADAAERIGFPVVLKAVNERIPHKAASGALALGLRDGAEVREAVSAIREAVLASAGVRVERFLVERQVTGVAAELFVGIKREEGFGLLLVAGAGGGGVEEQGGRATVLLPASEDDLRAAIGRLAIGRRLAAGGVPLEGAVTAIAAIARFALDNAERLAELDVNPLLVLTDGSAVAVDALMVWAAAAGAESPTGDVEGESHS